MRFFWLGIMNDAVGRWRPSWRHPREMRSTHDDVESERELELVLADELDEGVGDELRLGLLGGGRVATHRPSESLGGLLGGAAAGDQRSAGHLERRHGGHVCPGVCADPVWWRELSRRGAYLAVPGRQSSPSGKESISKESKIGFFGQSEAGSGSTGDPTQTVVFLSQLFEENPVRMELATSHHERRERGERE